MSLTPETAAHTATVLVCSCDRYADMLLPFSALWRKYWPDCPFATYLVTESAPTGADLCFDRVLALGKGTTWASRLVLALEQITTPYVLMLCDDYLLEAPVNTAQILHRLASMPQLNAANLRLIPNPKKGIPQEDGLMCYPKNTAYCISTLAGFWARDFLLGLARKSASIWEFERFGSFAVADEPRLLLATRVREFPFVDAVHKGHWEKFGVAVCQANDLKDVWQKRGLPPLSARLTEAAKALVFALLPHTWIVRVQNALGAGMTERKVRA